MENFDLIIIGSGPGGYPAAAVAAEKGLRVAIIERDSLGGTCLNRGCIPTKALCATAQTAMTVAEAAAFGIEVPGPAKVDYAKAVERKDGVIAQLREGVGSLLAKVTLIKGDARLVKGEQPSVEVDGTVYTAPRVIIATGSQPASLPIPGAEHTVSSDQILSMTELPASLAVIGGGVIGLEFASIFAALGVEVTVVEYCPEVLPNMDAEVAKRLRTALKKRGIDFAVGAQVTAIDADHTVHYTQKGKEKTVTAEMVLMAVGRRPVVPAGAEEIGLKVGRRGIEVDPATLATNVDGIYAVGDVNGLCQLAHAATAQGLRVVGEPHALEPVPAAVFTVPEMAAVGMTEQQATDAGIDVKVGKSTFRANGKALAMGETEGMTKVVVDAATGQLLGATILGPHAADMIHELSTAMTRGIAASDVAHAVHAHPTLSEAMIGALEAVSA